MAAFLAVAEGRARHVLVYRTVQMMGGTVLSAGAAPADEDPEAKAATSAATSVMGDVGSLLAHHAFSAANWVAMHKSEEHTSELQSLMRISYAVFCLKKKTR